MPDVTAADVKALRERTDLPMMECKRALVEADGDADKAVEILKKQFKKIQDKRSENATEEGRIFIAITEDRSEAAMIEIQCESAPVATGEALEALGTAAVNQLLNGPGADSPEALMSQTPEGSSQSLQDLYEDFVNKIREKTVVVRIDRVAGPAGGYVHHDFKTGVVFQAKGEAKNPEILRDVAMHIAALKPVCCHAEELDAAIVEAERNTHSEAARASGKPEQIIDKIVDGQMKKFFAEKGVLLYQPFAKDDKKSVQQVLTENNLEAVGFNRWKVGIA
ncbi:MAG TPA: translation elongation factor Ts [Planctomycetaceae bacterium]|nr:translation elongation factor Ts [Planctomycetaceae bacterium]|tara:strand:+ start:230 stop:1066 length:837 start_codon:yes stop_codon:yes gene_type:complete